MRREIERWLTDVGAQPRVVGEVEDSGLLKALGQDGRGVFAMPEAVRAEVERQYEVECIGTVTELEARVFALTVESGELNPAVRSLLGTRLPD